METSERQYVLELLQRGQDRLTALVSDLSPEQWAFRPAANKWAISQVLQHVMKVENRVVGMVQQKLEGSPEPDKQGPAADATLIAALQDRSTPRQAPEPVQPESEPTDGTGLVAEFEKVRQRTAAFAGTAEQRLRHYFSPHPVFGELDCYQWLMLVALHLERHTEQIAEVKAAPGFPKQTAATA